MTTSSTINGSIDLALWPEPSGETARDHLEEMVQVIGENWREPCDPYAGPGFLELLEEELESDEEEQESAWEQAREELGDGADEKAIERRAQDIVDASRRWELDWDLSCEREWDNYEGRYREDTDYLDGEPDTERAEVSDLLEAAHDAIVRADSEEFIEFLEAVEELTNEDGGEDGEDIEYWTDLLAKDDPY